MDHLDIWHNIFEYAGFKTQIALVIVNSIFKNNLRITTINNVYRKYSDESVLLKQNIIESEIFRYVKIIKCPMDYISDLSFLKDLKILNNHGIYFHEPVTRQLNLIKMKIGNTELPDLSFMTNLKNLDVAPGHWNFKINCIDKLNLISLNAKKCSNKIKDISFMTTLKKLNILNCQIDQNGISGLDLVKLKINKKITDVSFMKNLKVLRLCEDSKIQENELKLLNLYELDINNNVSDVSFMTSLKILHAGPPMKQIGITGLDLIELYLYCNENILDVSFLHNLKILKVSACHLYQAGREFLDLVELYAGGAVFTNVSFMKNLKILDAEYSHINQNGIMGLDLFELNANKYIKDVSFMKNLKKLNGIVIK